MLLVTRFCICFGMIWKERANDVICVIQDGMNKRGHTFRNTDFLVFSIHLTNTTEAEKSRTMISWLQLKAFKPSLGLCGFVLHNLCVRHTCGFGKCPYCEVAIRERERP